MPKRIEKVAVLGAGTMGARISAHLANAGVPSYLLDIVPPDADGPMRNRFAAAGLEAAVKSKPAAFFEPSLARLVTIGNFEDDLKTLADVDWIIEAVVEDFEIKRSLLRRIEAIRKPGTIITTNTSGLPVAKIVEGFPDEFRRHWFGTHFFNPPRYMRLLEIIPTPDADPAAMNTIAHFCDLRLGKGVVHAKDTPNFIANRIGTFSALNVMRLMQEMDLSIEEVDALTGTAVGWPKMATFRLTDLVGLDVLGHVVRNAMTNIHDERDDLKLPDFFLAMLERKWLGDKTKGGFYKKQKGAEGEQRLALDWKTLEYRPQQRPKFAALEMAKTIDSLLERLNTLLAPSRDKASVFLWTVLSELWTYAANRIGEISNSVVEIDRAMKLGFNWDMGPFELWDAAGVAKTVKRMQVEDKPVSPNVQNLTQTIKFSPKPVVVAPFGMTLGGGCEVTLHAAARQPHAELYCGLVEVGVGLLPGGGGCKEMTIRAIHKATHIRPHGRGESVEMMEAMKQAFETVAMAKVSTSAMEARNLGFLSVGDNITMNRERVLSDAKERALELVHEGYRPLSPRSDIPAPGESILATLKLGVHIMREGDYISDHEVRIAHKVAEVLCGGAVTPGTLVSEQYLLDLEREAFKSLCGEKKTQERIQYTLKTGKTLRN